MNVEVRSPTRVDLAGGTIDFWPIHAMIGGCSTVNLSIDIFTSVRLSSRDDKKIDVHIEDQEYTHLFDDLEQLMESGEQSIQLLKTCLKYWRPNKGFTIKTFSQSPLGGGLGGSSSLMISMLKAFGQMFHKEWEINELVRVAHNLEAELLQTLTGTQDYYPAAQPGLCHIKYGYGGAELESIPCSKDAIGQRMILVYTGRSHNSGINNWQVVKAAVEKDQVVTRALHDIAEVSHNMALACKAQDWQALGELFDRDYRARIKMASSFNSPEIERLESISRASGAEAFNICGAGGGGCVMIWCRPEKKAEIVAAIEGAQFQVLAAQPFGL